jgi:hypothetical protein
LLIAVAAKSIDKRMLFAYCLTRRYLKVAKPVKKARRGGRKSRDFERVTFHANRDDMAVIRKVAADETLTESDVLRRACREFAQRHAKTGGAA